MEQFAESSSHSLARGLSLGGFPKQTRSGVAAGSSGCCRNCSAPRHRAQAEGAWLLPPGLQSVLLPRQDACG